MAFRSLSLHIRPERPLSGNAVDDARAVIGAIRTGHVYTALNSVGNPALFEFSATNHRGSAQAGDELPAGGPVTLRVRSNAPAAFTTTVWQGQQVLSGDHHERDFTVEAPEAPAVYRVEIRATDRDRSPLWLLSNPIYVRGAKPEFVPPIRSPATGTTPLFDGRDASAWKTETDPTSLAALDVVRGTSGPELALRFGLATGDTMRQFAAVGVAIGKGLAPHDRLTFHARSDKPMRLSVQLRAAGCAGGAGALAAVGLPRPDRTRNHRVP